MHLDDKNNLSSLCFWQLILRCFMVYFAKLLVGWLYCGRFSNGVVDNRHKVGHGMHV